MTGYNLQVSYEVADELTVSVLEDTLRVCFKEDWMDKDDPDWKKDTKALLRVINMFKPYHEQAQMKDYKP